MLPPALKTNKQKNLTHPQLEDSTDQQLILFWNFLLDVLVKAWLYSQGFGDGRKVIGTFWKRKERGRAHFQLSECVLVMSQNADDSKENV